MKVGIISKIIFSEHSGEISKNIEKVVLNPSCSELLELCKEIANTKSEEICVEITGELNETVRISDNCDSIYISSEYNNLTTEIVVFYQIFNIEADENTKKIYAICNYPEYAYADYEYSADIYLRGLNFGIEKIETDKDVAVNYFNKVKQNIENNYEAKLVENLDDTKSTINNFRFLIAEEESYVCTLFELKI